MFGGQGPATCTVRHRQPKKNKKQRSVKKLQRWRSYRFVAPTRVVVVGGLCFVCFAVHKTECHYVTKRGNTTEQFAQRETIEQIARIIDATTVHV